MAANPGSVQFHLFGEKPSTGNYSEIVNEDMDVLLRLGGLVHQTGGSATLDFVKLQSIIVSLQPWCLEQDRYRWDPSESVASDQVAGELLKLFAGPLAAKADPLLPQFAEFLSKLPDWSQTLACTYLVYLRKNKKGGYEDRGEIAVRSIEMSLQNAQYQYKYEEVNYFVDLSLIRKGGRDHDALQKRLQGASVQQFMSAENFFNAKLI
jgi:hypothetical protein